MGENIRNSSLTVGTTSLQVVPTLLEGQRTSLVITNVSTSAQVITLSWGLEAAANKGIVLYAGGSWSESRDNAFIPSNKQVWAVSTAAGGVIAIQERVATEGI